MIDFDSNRLIVPLYPPGAGGKFLINCLALNLQVEFQHRDLVGSFGSTEEKYQFLLERLQNASSQWDDLGLGCIELVQMNHASRLDRPIDETKYLLNTNKILEQLSDSGRYFSLVAHTLEDIRYFRSLWPNCRVIVFINNERFIQSRKRVQDPRYDSWIETFKIDENCFVWDTDKNYRTGQDFIMAFNLLCRFLKLPIVNPDWLFTLYAVWIDKIRK